ncbi:outer membrane beta-barrel protein [Ferrimonas gelatinilytica]|uniref:Outer membrane beta-barrel protein n=1 Tax=Ferrimonas gelatinilytica TaxID=1255257 RepID=A0ABP9S2C4_9GAMM
MRSIYIGLLFSALLTAPAQAERTFFIAPMAGYNFGGSLDVTEHPEGQERQKVGELKVEDAESFGLMFGVETQDPGNIYLYYSRQRSAFKEGDFGSPTGLDLDVDYYHIGGSLWFPRGRFEPYVTSSVGVTRLLPDGGVSSETRFSLGLGVGARYRLLEHLSIFADVRSFFIFMENSTSLVCPGEDGTCRFRIEGNAMIQGQATLGLMVRF